jgi:Domain of unknown function (DUF4337)
MMLAQQKAADLWAHYQAKSIREHQSRGERLRLELELAERGGTMTPEVRAKFEARRSDLEAEEDRYRGEKEKLQEEAKEQEHERNMSMAKDPYFDFGEVLLQIAIVMSSVAILSSSHRMFGLSLAIAFLGLLNTLNGFTLLFGAPSAS